MIPALCERDRVNIWGNSMLILCLNPVLRCFEQQVVHVGFAGLSDFTERSSFRGLNFGDDVGVKASR